MQKSVNGAPRVIVLDVMRGFAVMGILAMNIIGFSMPEWAYITPLAYSGETASDRIAWFVSFVFIDGKMRAMFSLLFGASMMLIIERASANGENAARVHFSRMIWLGLFGLAHYFLIWYGDILFIYAVAGSTAFLFRDWEPQRLIKWALIIFGLGILIWGAQFGGLQLLHMLSVAPDASPDLVRQYREIRSSSDFDFNIAYDLALHRGSYSGIVGAKLAEWQSPFVFLLQALPETLPLMMIGMAMKKNGFLTGEWPHADYMRWAIKMLVPGLFLLLLLGVALALSGYDAVASLATMFAWGNIPRLMVTVGYAAVLIMLAERFSNGKLIARIAATGQAAFTNYLGTSIVMTTIFYGYGFGLFGFVDRLQVWAFVLAAWALMLLWSKPWLVRFRYGPLEWLWRSLARMKTQALRR